MPLPQQTTSGTHPDTFTVEIGPWRCPTCWVIVDLDGASRHHAATHAEARAVLLEAERDYPGIAAELFVVTYDADGRIGPAQHGDVFLAGGDAS